ncbi:MAG: PAS domain S-box protein [Candidatus Thiodiazotropha sp. (ex Dulcina madagascariensis)]|nr:PAS domain S-box protein [Candidatus Thiodiazotropha sp. (ex Dulcina madagascariensis)]MCU7925213.1 PAS domain S-box protein [Candidatus Thiodiazotropha sp. (ex Dulcina madagascariensis)]MCU7933517.1 PAS domain S-box protein [Candidatus Thiodiazotropha sp. (ex Dulcina madagascariensis)]
MKADTRERPNISLIDEAGVGDPLQLTESTESAWIDVIQKMDKVYADLVHYQVELEQKNAALEEAQQFIGSVLESMTDALIVCDIQGRIQQVNRALERLSGKQEQDLLQRSISEIFCVDSQPLVDSFPEKLGSDSIIDCEVNLSDLDGRPVPLAMNCSSRYDTNGRLMGMVLIGRPVGELRRAYEQLNKTHLDLKQTQQQLVHSEKMASLGRLVAGVAHELNNPISFVFGNMHALKRYGERINHYFTEVGKYLDPDLHQRLREAFKIDHIEGDIGPLIEGTLEGAERISDIVLELRRYSGIQKESPELFDLTKVIDTATQWVIKACREKPEVVFRPEGLLEVTGRKGQVHQILVNLVQNAVDVMEQRSGARLGISCGLEGESAWIKVRDNGPGIPDEDLRKLFDPFFTTKAVGKGTGLGLYISYGLARDLGGDLLVDNHPDGGAEFTLLLPLDGKTHG